MWQVNYVARRREERGRLTNELSSSPHKLGPPCYNDAKNDIRLDCLRRAANWLIGWSFPVIAQAARALVGSPDKLRVRSRAGHRAGAAL
jgi:hypothetical protein